MVSGRVEDAAYGGHRVRGLDGYLGRFTAASQHPFFQPPGARPRLPLSAHRSCVRLPAAGGHPRSAVPGGLERLLPSARKSLRTGRCDGPPPRAHFELLAPNRRGTTSSFLPANHRGFERGFRVSSPFTVTSAILALLYPVSNDPGCDGPGVCSRSSPSRSWICGIARLSLFQQG